MASKTIKVGLNSTELRKLSKEIDDFRFSLINEIHTNYLKKCLDYIKDTSIKYLNADDTFKPSFISDIREKIKELKFVQKKGCVQYVLTYYSDIVSFVEFGTGLIGQTEEHPMSKELGYKYASGEVSSKYGVWTWYNADYKMSHSVQTFGYVGKRFIYKAYQDFLYEKKYEEFFEESLESVFLKYFK